MKPGKPVPATVGPGGQPPVDELLTDIRTVIERARQQAITAVNTSQTYMYWRIGQRIHTELLVGERVATIGAGVRAGICREKSAPHGAVCANFPR